MSTLTAADARPSLWRNRAYVTWLVSDTAGGLGAALVSFALPLVALAVTDEPVQAGVIGGVGAAVRVMTTLGGGVLADRRSRVRLMIAGGAVGAIIASAFLVLSLGDALTFSSLLAVNALLAGREGFFGPAGEAALKDLVPAAAMGRAQAANQGRNAVLDLAGGPLGGVLLAVGAWLVAAVVVACQVAAAATAWALGRRALARPPAVTAERGGALADIRQGFAWLFARRDLRGVLIVVTIINLGLSSLMTTVIYALQQAGRSPVEIGWLSTGIGAAMLAGALAAPLLVARVPAGILLMGGLTVMAGAAVALPFVDALIPVILLVAGALFLLPAMNAGMGGYVMVAVPTELVGRANAASMVLSMGAMPLAPLLAGVGLGWVGRGPTLAVCAGLCAVAALLALTSRPLRALPAERGWAGHAARFAGE
ncbi:MFS transporter [Microbacterium karelineae]|uniref:MFS transporter n=1 Tax=Microbacterium karelineae TaxID=2654283 RepID=UPI0012E9DD86|nr:MFS transporter [Microbacterium karelineae]